MRSATLKLVAGDAESTVERSRLLEQPQMAIADRATVMLKTVEKSALLRRNLSVSSVESSTYLFVEFQGVGRDVEHARLRRSNGASVVMIPS